MTDWIECNLWWKLNRITMWSMIQMSSWQFDFVFDVDRTCTIDQGFVLSSFHHKLHPAQSVMRVQFIFGVDHTYTIVHVIVVRNSGLLHSHALDHVRCMQIYPRLSKYIIADKWVFKNNKNTIENIDLENKATYLWFECSLINSIHVDTSKVSVDLVNTMIFRPMTLPCV